MSAADLIRLVAFQGHPGAYSDLACRAMFPGVKTLPCRSFEDAFAAVAASHADRAMIPIENSVAGRVADVHHLMPSLRMMRRHCPSAWTWLSTVLMSASLAPRGAIN